MSLTPQLRLLIEELRERTFPYEPRPKKKRDHAAYDWAKSHELVEMLQLIRRLVERAVQDRYPGGVIPQEDRVGRPDVHEADDLAKALLVQQYFGLGNRETVSAMVLFQEKLGIKKVCSYKTVERAYEDPDVRALILTVERMINEEFKDVERGVIADGTGVPRSTKVNYASRREQQRREGDRKGGEGAPAALPLPTDHQKAPRAFVPLVFAMGMTTQLIVHQVVPPGRALVESPYFPELLERATQVWPHIELVSLDSAYLSRLNCTLIEEKGADPRIFPKRGVSLKRLGSDAWAHMYLDLLRDPQGWLSDYHLRSLIEAVNRVYHWTYIRPVLRKRAVRVAVEQDVRCTVYDLERYLLIRHLIPRSWEASRAG